MVARLVEKSWLIQLGGFLRRGLLPFRLRPGGRLRSDMADNDHIHVKPPPVNVEALVLAKVADVDIDLHLSFQRPAA